MENEVKEKGSVKCKIIFIFTLIIALGVIGCMGYLLYDANKTITVYKDVSAVPKSEGGTNEETDCNVGTPTDAYDTFIKNLSKKSMYEISFVSLVENGRSTIYLTKDNEVYLSSIDSDDDTEKYVTVPGTEGTIDEARAKKTDIKDVARVYPVEIGNAGYRYVFMLKTNGEFHLLDATTMNSTKNLDIKNVVTVESRSVGSGVNAYAIDIDGKEHDLYQYVK